MEGNRRFAAVLALRDPGLLPRSGRLRDAVAHANVAALETLPCVVYERREEILDYLGNRHIEGVRPWEPLAKARYLRQLCERLGALGVDHDDRALARKIGSRADYVRRLLRTLDAFEALEREGLAQPSEARFSVLSTALSYANIGRYAGVTFAEEPLDARPEELAEVGRWLFEPYDERSRPRVATSRQLPDLDAVVGDDRARAVLEEGRSLPEALRETRESAEALLDALLEAVKHLHEAVRRSRSLGAAAAERERDREAAALEAIGELYGQLQSLLLDVDAAVG